jgi:predicted ATP-dependent endonuclease of OLD family
MKITKLTATNIKCFERVEMELSRSINVIVGQNNSGKSALLRCLSIIQDPNPIMVNFKRLRSKVATIELEMDNDLEIYYQRSVQSVRLQLENENLGHAEQ